MPIICLEFPSLAVDIARKRYGFASDRPLVLVDGPGPGARVTARCAAAAAMGVLREMPAGAARRLAPGAAFLPGDGGEPDRFLESAAEAILLAGLGVTERDGPRLIVHCGRVASLDEVVAAAGVGGVRVVGGWGRTRAEAVAAARHRSRATVTLPVVEATRPVEALAMAS